MQVISRSEILQEIDHWICYENIEGKEVFRELEKYGNRHLVFDKGAEYGYIHYDQHNATSFPIGTINHLAKWANEKTGVNEGLGKLVLWGLGIYAGYKAIKYIDDNF